MTHGRHLYNLVCVIKQCVVYIGISLDDGLWLIFFKTGIPFENQSSEYTFHFWFLNYILYVVFSTILLCERYSVTILMKTHLYVFTFLSEFICRVWFPGSTAVLSSIIVCNLSDESCKSLDIVHPRFIFHEYFFDKSDHLFDRYLSRENGMYCFMFQWKLHIWMFCIQRFKWCIHVIHIVTYNKSIIDIPCIKCSFHDDRRFHFLQITNKYICKNWSKGTTRSHFICLPV